MPELPEVECVRRSLVPALLGRTLGPVTIHRPGIVDGPATTAALLARDEIVALERRGKQLALIARSGRVLIVHLGMTGQLLALSPSLAAGLSHVHVQWSLPASRVGVAANARFLLFRDPRRFGGLTPLASRAALDQRWSALGPDALGIEPGALRESLRDSRRPIKAALLDQAVLAGVGNIYADEALFAAGIAPRTPAGRLSPDRLAKLAEAIRTTLMRAIESGGSSLRDYVDGNGRRGGFVTLHQVYGRGADPCRRCGTTLASALIAQRTTVWCPRCQAARRERTKRSTRSFT
ncbi:MAG: bifunctional DNA-formamidopyrimidine glycosylase/DNA-(apurinic or apyrimidinic site) lyase [Phycisphaerales bacterium]